MSTITVKRIEGLCKEKEINITSLESTIGIAKGSIRKWDKVNPSIDKIIRIADYFSVSSDYLLGLSDSRYSVEDEENDGGLVSLKRARSKMSKREKERMDILMSITFPELFKERDNGTS